MKVRLDQIKNTQAQREHGNLADLKASIADVGLINPLTIDENFNLLAGRRRYQALVELGWQEAECYVLPVNGDQVMAMSVAVEENLRRKDLTEVEKAVMLAELEELKRKQYGSARRGERTDLTSSKFDEVWTQNKTAEVLNVSRPTVSRNLKIARAIKEYPDLASYAEGAPVLKEYARRERQKQPIKPMLGDNIKVILGDMRQELEKLNDDSVSLILTDPPYSAEFLSLWTDLARIAKRILKSSGFLITYSGQLYLDKVMASLSEHLTYYWLASIWLKGAPVHRYERNIQNAFKPVLIYQKQPLSKQSEWLVDLLCSPASDKKYHDWGQSEAPIAELLEAFTNPGDFVVDPFCGGGTVPYVCKKLNRKCLTMDNDKDAYQTTLLRLQKEDAK